LVILGGIVALAIGVCLLMLVVYAVAKDGSARDDQAHLDWLDYLARHDEDGVSDTGDEPATQ
jgi:hypothetical protein